MGENNGGMSCSLGCWLLAAGAGVLTFVMLLLVGNAGLMQAIFLGGLVFVLLGLLFTWLFCSALPKPGEARSDATASTGGAATAGAAAAAAGAAVAAGAAKSSASDAGASASGAQTAASSGASTDASGSADAVAETAADTVSDSGSASGAEAGTASAPAEAEIKPSTRLPGQEDLASRKGTWKYEGSADAASGDASGADAGASEASAGEAAADAGASASAADASADASLGEDYDKDGVREGSDEGSRPEALDGPRGGKADNLKEIKGIGPKLEKLCNSLGFYHFDQIANWSDDEVAWVNANLEGFKGRVSRDQWVAQAKILAAGGETEFSKRVDDGKVY